jgi:hypothetical protein
MHPASIIRRTMTCARRTTRALLIIAWTFGSFVSAGCLRSTLLQPGDGAVPQSAPLAEPAAGRSLVAPAQPSPKPDVDYFGNPISATLARPDAAPPAGATSSPPSAPQRGMPPQQIESASAPLGRQPDAVTLTGPEPVSETPAGNATPLLDAAIERVAAVTRQDDSVNTDMEASPPDDGAPRADAQRPPTVSPIASTPQPAETSRSADTPASIPAMGPSLLKNDDPTATVVVSVVPRAETASVRVDDQPKSDAVAQTGSALPWTKSSANSDEHVHAAIDVAKPVPVNAEPDPLGINKLTLCRKVLGFGSFEPLAATRVKAGQRFLVYCEMTGMRYEEKHSEFVSRLSSRIEIMSIANGTTIWMRELGPETDVCGSRRHDFYVNYRVDVPSSVPAGLYSLRLTQTDLVAQRSTSAEIPLEIVP